MQFSTPVLFPSHSTRRLTSEGDSAVLSFRRWDPLVAELGRSRHKCVRLKANGDVGEDFIPQGGGVGCGVHC